MVKINKTQPAPGAITCDRDYQQGIVFETICKDFHCKCYLCEDKPTSINIEHIVSHKGDVKLKHEWDNLFFACSHCNNIKGIDYDDIIDCTKKDPEEIINFIFKPYPRKEPEFKLVNTDASNQEDIQTIILLEKIFCKPPTSMKSKESIELCNRLYEEFKKLIKYIEEYFEAVEIDENVERCYTYVINHLNRKTPFAAFKRAFARQEYFDSFEEALE